MQSMLTAVAKAAGLDDPSAATGGQDQRRDAKSSTPVQMELGLPNDAVGQVSAEGAPLHLADVHGIAQAALQYQAAMAAGGRNMSIAEAVTRVTMQSGGQGNTLRAAAPPSAAGISSFYAEVSASWNTEPGLRKQYASFPAYVSAREFQFCRDNAIGLEQLKGEKDAKAAFLDGLAKTGRPVTAEAAAKINAAHAAWEASADIRKEFVSFHSYAWHHLLKQ